MAHVILVSAQVLGLDFGTLDFGTSDSGYTLPRIVTTHGHKPSVSESVAQLPA